MTVEYKHTNGNHEWYLNGKLHRLDGPAIIYPDGGEEWYKHGVCHRVDGPAIIHIYSDGKREDWYDNGNRHRLDGPAVICKRSSRYYELYYINDVAMSKEDHAEHVNKIIKTKQRKIAYKMMKSAFLAMQDSQMDTNFDNDNSDYYYIPKALVNDIITNIP